MSERKTLKKRTNTFTGLSGALLSTSGGQFIQALTFQESNDIKENKGTVVFDKNVPNSFMNFCIYYEDSDKNKTYIRLIAPKVCGPEVLERGEAYSFTFSEVWKKDYDKTNHMISERYGWQ